MPNYDWTCSVCGSPNQAGSDICTACNSPAEISGLEVESLQFGVSNVSDYLRTKVRTYIRAYIRDPCAKDMFKVTILFGLMFGLAGLSIWLEIAVIFGVDIWGQSKNSLVIFCARLRTSFLRGYTPSC